ncbi:ATP-binding protein [Imperialibacter roseus]|uniref:histidine kinase n=1 Tax=Imperialibacter roseus TaxID=1324217 RepID=A0ABZ0IK88_9BACT|nr:ATP-binding protein [Imperialibacter roseus]WOK04191.1 ATP-binding protein [Imperialibacter roseus]
MTRTKSQKSQYARSLLEASLDPLVTISAEGKITDVNEALMKVTGLQREELIGTDFSTYFTSPKKAQEGYLQVFEKGFVSGYPLTIKHKDGGLIDVLYNASVYKDSRGNVLGVFAAARDVTEQKWAIELRKANKELAFQNEEKEKRAAELVIANKELLFQNKEKEKRAAELSVANIELVFQNGEKEKRAAELVIANEELVFQNKEKEKRAAELSVANIELVFQNGEKEKRAAELGVANGELAFQNNEKEKRAAELNIANKELAFQNDEKEKRAAELRLANYARSLIEASRDPLVTISTAGKITDMNEAFVSITASTREKLVGSDFGIYFTDPVKAREIYEEVFTEGFVADYPLTIIDHGLTAVLFNGSVYKNEKGDVLGAVVVARDITEQKRIEKELIEAKVAAELATTIAEEAKEKAESAAQIAESAVKAKQQFLSNMSHEIRTPMNAIIGFTKVVLKTDLSAKQREYLTAIKISGDSLIVLINDILDLAKVDAGKMVFEEIPFKMASSLSAMLHLFETKIQEKNLLLIKEYDETIPEVLIGDPVRLHQIILNLVSNAVKFTSRGKITVSVRMLASEEEEKVNIEFAISDTGIGITEDKLERIFDNFQQASSGTSRLYGGTGLGLAIVKQLVEPQGGSIQVKSKIGEGTTFSFILSFGKTNEEAVLDVIFAEPDKEIKDIKVLVVEDIALNQLLMKTLLDDFGFERDIAENGRIAIKKLEAKSYDIILMDLQMPEMNGFEATEYIRNTMNLKTPIIALTADVTTVDLEKCRVVGMDDYISKPVDERLLCSKIVSLVKRPPLLAQDEDVVVQILPGKIVSCIDLTFLNQRTKSDPKLMMEMISLYLEQTPPLISTMKKSFAEKDWTTLYSAVHKMIPSFSIMGIHTDFEKKARALQEFASTQQQPEEISALVLQLGNVCTQACTELKQEYNKMKTSIHEN